MGINDISADAAVDLKKSARRRLVGAIALALLAVIVLPLVMEHEPKPTAQDIQIRIPSQDAAEPPLPAGVPEVSKGSEPASERTAAVPEKASPAGAPAAVTAPAKPAAPPVAAAKPPEKSPPDRASATTSSSSADVARAEAVLNGGETDQYLVRLGAYQNAANVRQLLAKVKEMGVPVYAEKFDSPNGPRSKVLAGPFASREAAEKAQAKVKRIGVEGMVILKQ